jgi:hypothetical protein
MGEKIDTAICKKCLGDYDPSMEFVEDYELLMAVDYFTDLGSIDKLCPECVYELAHILEDVTKEWEDIRSK